MTSDELEAWPVRPELELWRVGRFRQLGFDEIDATALACSPADLHLVEDLLAAGCPLGLAFEIAL